MYYTAPQRLSGQKPSTGIRQAAGALIGCAAGPLAVSALSISSIVRPRVSKPMNSTAINASLTSPFRPAVSRFLRLK
jgi:hypothetical protein